MINAGGNGSGKTYGLIAVCAAFIWPNLAPPCFSQTFKNWKHPKKVWIVSNPSELGDTGAIQSTIDELWPRGQYDAEKKGKLYQSKFKSNTGWTIELKSTEQDEKEFRGASVGLIVVNEPLPERIWRELIARTRRGGIIIGAMTSLYDEPWVVDGLLNKHNGQDYRILYGGVEENCKDHTSGGTLSHARIEQILAQYPEDEREARRTGRPLGLSGRILKSFDQAVHVIRGEYKLPKECSIIQVVDPAIGKPLAVIYANVDPAGQLVIYDEYPHFDFDGAPDDNLTVSDYARIFQTIEMGHGRPVDSRILDRHFGNQRRTLGGLTLKEEFGNAGVNFFDSYALEDSVEVETGIRKMKDFLHFDAKKPIDNLNRPKLLVHESCTNTIASLQNWARNSKTLKPMEKYKDFADCVRYLVMSEPQMEVKREWRQGPTAKYGVSA